MVGGTIGLGFQVMLIPLIYLISGWRWALFTSDVPLLDETEDREIGEDNRSEQEDGVVSGAGWWDGWSGL